MTAIVLCGLLTLQMMLISGCTAQRTKVDTVLQELNSSLQSVQQQSVDAFEASIQASQAEAASIQASQAEAASIQASQAEAASIQASQAAAASIQASQAEAASIQASQAEAASIQASQAEAASIQASQAAAASIQASQAEAASIQASQAEASSIQASQAAAQASQAAASQPPEGHEGPWVGGRTVYLTFDDGPSYLTPQVLDILDRYQVKATFFVTYTEKPEIVPYYSEIVRRGHTIGIHTASHNYEQIYSSMEAFVADFEQIYNYVRNLTGVSCQLYRFPGGSTTGLNLGLREQIKAWLQQRGMIYHDWNVVNGDGANVTADEAYHNVVDNIVQRTHPIVLMHDAVKKETTVEALPRIIETLQSWGFTFAALDSSVEPIHHGINW